MYYLQNKNKNVRLYRFDCLFSHVRHCYIHLEYGILKAVNYYLTLGTVQWNVKRVATLQF